MANEDSWTTIESDPGVFTELLNKIGVQGAEVQELYALEADHLKDLRLCRDVPVSGCAVTYQKKHGSCQLQACRPVYGLIFLFKWQAGLGTEQKPEDTNQVYFAQQVINNACATQAMLAVLLNQDDEQVDIGEPLRNLRDFTQDFPPDMRGHTIGNADSVRQAHNSFAAPEAHLSEEKARKATDDDDVYHFVSYIHKMGAIWELDGLQRGPIKCCECSESEWLDQVGGIINKRIAAYSAREIRFNLMAIVKDKRAEWQSCIEQLQSELAKGEDAKLSWELSDTQTRLRQAHDQHERWAVENVRRRHNYVPFIFNVFQVLAERDELQPLLDQAKTAAQERAQSMNASKVQ